MKRVERKTELRLVERDCFIRCRDAQLDWAILCTVRSGFTLFGALSHRRYDFFELHFRTRKCT
jgi:hypothetical protein